RTDRPMATPAGGHAERPEAPAQLHGRTATLAREELQGVVVLQPPGEELRAMRAQGAEHAGRDGHTGKRAGEPERPVTRCRRGRSADEGERSGHRATGPRWVAETGGRPGADRCAPPGGGLRRACPAAAASAGAPGTLRPATERTATSTRASATPTTPRVLAPREP